MPYEKRAKGEYMKAIICDRCKKVFEPKMIRLVRINRMVDITSFEGSHTEQYEICDECYNHMFGEVKTNN
jgi:hypothetical protein